MPEPSPIQVPHLAFPLRLTTEGTLAAVDQDTIDDVRQCVHVLMRTQLGSRPLAPEVGIEDPTFTTGFDAESLSATLAEQEDRARVTITAPPVDGTGRQRVRVEVELADEEAEAGDVT